jgi:hypothetical protein
MIDKVFQYFWRPIEKINGLDDYSINQKVNWIYGLLTVFYGFLFLKCFDAMYKGSVNGMIRLADFYNPKWPIIVFSSITQLETVGLIKVVLFFSILICGLGLFYGIRYRIVRVLVCVGFLLFVALSNSFSKGHGHHLAVWASFFLIFIPSKNQINKSNFVQLFRVIFIIRTFILLTYFSSGCFKIFRLIQHSFEGKMTAIHKFGFANLVAKDWYTTKNETFFGSVIVYNESYIWPIVLLAGFLIELTSIIIIFKPSLDKIWFLLYICLHLGILLALGPNFSDHLFVVALFIGFNVFSQNHRREIMV